MKNFIAACITAIVATTGVAAAERTADDLVAAIQDLDVSRVNSILDAHPDLASAKGPGEIPVLLFAVFAKPKGAPFVRPEDNELVAALLAREPQLGVWEAALLGRTARVRELVDAHPEMIESQAASTWRTLHFAAFSGNPETVRYLLARGANIEAVAERASRTRPLHAALLARRLETARVLLESGADIHARQTRGFTALHEAALGGDRKVVDMLLDFGADPGAKTNTCESVSDSARRAGHEGLAAYLQDRESTEGGSRRQGVEEGTE